MSALFRLGSALLACAALQVILAVAPYRGLVLVAGASMTLLAAGASLRHAWLARGAAGSARAAWCFTSAATGLWAIGAAFYTHDVVAGVTAPPPRIGDWFCFAAVCLAPCVLVAGPSAPVSWEHRSRITLDGLMVATALFVPAWPMLLKPTQQLVGSAGGVLAAAIPLLHIVCISIAVVLLSRSRSLSGNAVIVLVGGFATFATATLVYIGLALHGSSWQVHRSAGGFMAATVLLLFAGSYPMPVNDRPWLEAPTGLRAAVPYVPVVAAFAVMVVLERRDAVDAVVVTALVLIGVLILGRQFLALRSNAQLLAEVAAQREQLVHLATHDHLTGLPNRMLLHDRVREGVARALNDGSSIAVLIVDLDGFKQVNDELGHGAGDEVLIRVAAALRGVVQERQLPARLGGDEFAVLLHPLTSEQEALAVAGRIIAAIVATAAPAGWPMVGASVGVAYEPGHRATLGTLLADADAALYRAKAGGKGRAVLHARPEPPGTPVRPADSDRGVHLPG